MIELHRNICAKRLVYSNSDHRIRGSGLRLQ